MTTFDKREEGFEKKFAHDEELRFKANARRNKLLGMWAAEKMGLTGPAADAYAKEVVVADFEEAGDDDVFRKVRKDFDAKGVAMSDQDIRKTMIDLMALGRRPDQDRLRATSAPAGTRCASPRHRFCRWNQADGRSRRLSPSLAVLPPARPFTLAGARCRRRSSPRPSREKVSSPSPSTSSTACGIPQRPRLPSPRSARSAPHRSCACRSARSRPQAARSTSAPKASSRR